MFDRPAEGFRPVEKVSRRNRENAAELSFEMNFAEKIQTGLLGFEPHEAASHLMAAKFAYKTCLIQSWVSKDDDLQNFCTMSPAMFLPIPGEFDAIAYAGLQSGFIRATKRLQMKYENQGLPDSARSILFIGSLQMSALRRRPYHDAVIRSLDHDALLLLPLQ